VCAAVCAAVHVAMRVEGCATMRVARRDPFVLSFVECVTTYVAGRTLSRALSVVLGSATDVFPY